MQWEEDRLGAIIGGEGPRCVLIIADMSLTLGIFLIF